jgi:hypothetical protein
MVTRTHQPLLLGEILKESATLAKLGAQVQASDALFQHLLPHIPASLRAAVKPGPKTEESLCLLAPNGSAAAKLKQMIPILEQALAQAGHPGLSIRLRVLGK